MNSIFPDFNILDQIFLAPERPGRHLASYQATNLVAFAEFFELISPLIEVLSPGSWRPGALIPLTQE